MQATLHRGKLMNMHERFNSFDPQRQEVWYRILRTWLANWFLRHRSPIGQRWYDADGFGL